MANRLTKIYTRMGDTGTTGLADGSRMVKNHPRIVAIGYTDELNSQLGLLQAQLVQQGLSQFTVQLQSIQQLLFNLGGELASPQPKHILITSENVKWLEENLDQLNSKLPPLTDFILPQGSLATCQAHVCRSVCRQTEISLITLSEAINQQATSQPINCNILAFINRLSDWLFVFARTLSALEQTPEVLWQKQPQDTQP